MACPSACEQCKGHLPLASVGRWPSALLLPSGERPKWPPATLLPNFEFLIFPLSAGPFGAPSPDLDLPVRRLWRLCCCFAMRAGHRRRGQRRRREWCRVGHARVVLPALPLKPVARTRVRASAGAAQSRRQRLLSLRLSLRARVCARKRPDAAVFMDPCESRQSDGLGWIKSESDRPTFAFDRRCPWPGAAGAFRIIGVLASRSLEDATWLILPVVICLSQRLSHACDRGLPWYWRGWAELGFDSGGSLKAATTSKEGSGGAKLPNRHGELDLGLGRRSASRCVQSTSSLLRRCAPGLNWRVVPRCCYFEEIRVLKASLRSGYISMG
ncbi:hypothetical protein H6P81_021708 [Aristolochia fimbriata]|uniref:Uncharacterized protein n=1 Tax=Aristolochia fimbriata TaxID=158543 RepID=A0AAV7DP77_ARIFI|nr:hypothetical protein H6P81_021708 [Aristolochia fimbriata]